ncbi:MAG: beta-lactamase family protein [Candidatus Sericytochromatia bacterium]|nr:beta-lactamase family protein [Candidatus Tanganyikabacteria bacterium]
MKLRTLAFIIAVAVLSGCAGFRRETVAPGDFAGLRKQLGDLVAHKMKDAQVEGASVVLVNGDATVLEAGYGVADKEGGRKADADTLYCVGSVTKLFTATTIMRLVEQGKIDLDKPIKTYLPEFSIKSRFPEAGPITLRSILTHHSGLPSDRLSGMFTKAPAPYATILTALRDEYVASPPWHAFSYSNLGFDVAAIVAERVSGKPYPEAVREAVLRPAGMDATTFDPTAPLVSKTYHDGAFDQEPGLRDTPAGGMYSSARDLGRFMRMVMAGGKSERGRVIEEATLDEMLRPQNAHVPLDFSFRIGLAWILDHRASASDRVIGHNGATINYHTALAIDVGNKLGVALLTNSRRGGEIAGAIVADALEMAREASGKKADPKVDRPAAAPDADPAAIAAHAGFYSTVMGAAPLRAAGKALRYTNSGWDAEVFPLMDGTFGARLLLLGFFPLELDQTREIRLAFRDVAGRHVLTAMAEGGEFYAGERLTARPLPDSWQARIGDYDISNLGDDHPLIHGLSVKERGGFAIVSGNVSGSPLPMTFALQPISDDEAIILGTGRSLGETVRVVRGASGEKIVAAGYELVRRQE